MDLKLTYAGEVDKWSVTREHWHVNDDSAGGMLVIEGALEIRTLASSLDLRLEMAQPRAQDFFCLMKRLAEEPKSVRMEITVIVSPTAKDD